MPLSARTFGDIWVGICCCHPPIPCVGMAGPIITGSPDAKTGGLPQARLTDMTIGYCGHPGVIVSGSALQKTNGLPTARLSDSVTGCNIGVVATGNPTHEVG